MGFQKTALALAMVGLLGGCVVAPESEPDETDGPAGQVQSGLVGEMKHSPGDTGDPAKKTAANQAAVVTPSGGDDQGEPEPEPWAPIAPSGDHKK
jgi:hypothetical protein